MRAVFGLPPITAMAKPQVVKRSQAYHAAEKVLILPEARFHLDSVDLDDPPRLLDLVQRHAVLVLRFGRVAAAVVDERVDAELAQLREDVGHLAVAQVVAVFLERQAQDTDARPLHLEALPDQHLRIGPRRRIIADRLLQRLEAVNAGELEVGKFSPA